MFEVLDHFKNEINSSQVLDDFNLESEKYFVVSAHREENVDFDWNFNKLINCLNSLAEQFLLPIIVSTHPRTRARVDSKNIKFHSLVTLMKPLGFLIMLSCKRKQRQCYLTAALSLKKIQVF